MYTKYELPILHQYQVGSDRACRVLRWYQPISCKGEFGALTYIIVYPSIVHYITLLSTFGKLFSKIITFTSKHRLVLGGKWGRSIIFLYCIKHFVNEGKRLYAAFIDFTKAFDYVVRENVWLKLI